jgi:hypothetical protein
MCKVTKPRVARKPVPAEPVTWELRPSRFSPFGYVRIASERKAASYRIALIPTAGGIGLEIAEQTGLGEADCYHVFLDPEAGGHTCECKGFLRWGHCKHSQGLWDMYCSGDLDCLLNPPDDDDGMSVEDLGDEFDRWLDQVNESSSGSGSWFNDDDGSEGAILYRLPDGTPAVFKEGEGTR